MTHPGGREQLQSIAHAVMLQRGLLPDFSAAVVAETNQIARAAAPSDTTIRDLRGLPWASIDNDDSRDLDQLSVAEPAADGAVKILVAIADVDALVKKDSAIDGHAWTNTTSVYTAAKIFPMLPEKLSTGLTSLNEGQELVRAVFEDGGLADLLPDEKNRAKELIEDFMIAANSVTAKYLERKGFASLRRVLKTPKRWDRIVALAAESGERLPPTPDAAALDEFLMKSRETDPARFADLSLSVVKLLGSGEYALEVPGQRAEGHFGLAVKDYTHSWVRISGPSAEGRVVRGFEGLDVGERVRVKLVHTDVARGFIDFAAVRQGS
jgi:exoribonuclease R